MSTSQNVVRKRYGLFVLAILLLLFAGVCIYLGSNNYPIRVLGLAAIMASVYLARISHVRDRSGLPEASGRGKDRKTATGPGRLVWAVGVALLVVLGISSLSLYRDALRGYHEVLPVYIFAGIAVVCALFWSYLLSTIFR